MLSARRLADSQVGQHRSLSPTAEHHWSTPPVQVDTLGSPGRRPKSKTRKEKNELPPRRPRDDDGLVARLGPEPLLGLPVASSLLDP
ncbi:hypothetical protein THAOC_21192, partial [Thalassiosira oceanica]